MPGPCRGQPRGPGPRRSGGERSGGAPLARSLRVLLVAWGGSAGLVLLLLGSATTVHLAAAGGIGLVAAVAAVVTERQGSLNHRLRWRWLRLAWRVPYRTMVDFGILTRELGRALATGRPRQGAFRTMPFPADRSPGRRAWIGMVGGYTPNAYVVELDPARRLVLVHDLVPSDRSEQPT